MGWFSDKKAETNEKDRKAREKVDKLRKERDRREGKDRINPALAKDLNDIQRSWGYKGERGWF